MTLGFLLLGRSYHWSKSNYVDAKRVMGCRCRFCDDRLESDEERSIESSSLYLMLFSGVR